MGTFIAFLDKEVVTSIKDRFMVGFIMFNATFNYTSVISWWRKLEKTTDLRKSLTSFITYTVMLYCLSEISTHNVSGDRY